MREYPIQEGQAEDLLNRFRDHPPLPDQAERYAHLRARATVLASSILVCTPPSREQAIALTNLEQAVMWANAAIARHETAP